ncbi:MAG: CbbQ/NirQ/NorQ/GpvN family protein [SAR202 cluster bacterium]|nr:CbbQ/NirQ/NorQ/GpvN family protein [SAR202 cluster bacterium]|tara:strand:- start:84369 stop:85253 length:885 start_codon:yes stop_codon:yes gene_type:complete
MARATQTLYNSYIIEEYFLKEEPFYVPVGDEIELFTAAYEQRIPILFKGPTGCGKTRFVEYMSWKLGTSLTKLKKSTNDSSQQNIPLVTIACHEDLTASDLVGRYLLKGDTTEWIDGPLTRAVKSGGICYLDEIVEARKDTTVLIHPLTDHRRVLPVEKKGEIIEASEGFLLVMSYNPGYQSALKDLKHSTRQRFVSIEFNPPVPEIEKKIIQHESGVSSDVAESLAKLGEKIRNLKEQGLEEGASTRLLIYAGKMIAQGIAPRRACQISVNWAVTDDQQLQKAIEEVTFSIFE